ncbi:MAG: glycosyl hydrolase family 28 protein [Thermoguttaceae bacterium]
MNRGRIFCLVPILCLALLESVGYTQATQATQDKTPLNVREFGALGNGTTKDTTAFQKALDACAAAGGGAVFVPAGNYLIGSIALKSNTTLRLQKDANLTGSPDLDDYPIIKARWEGRWVDAHRALLSAQDAKNIAVVGPGQIAANPALGGRQMPRRPCAIEPINCTGVRLEDFSVKHRHMWAIHPTCCENLTAKNLTLRTTETNGDGIDIDSCKHVRIEFCDIESGDDCIAVKSGRGMEGFREAKPSEDILISHCTLSGTMYACIGIGSETSGGIRDVRIEHCKLVHSAKFAIHIKSREGRGAFIDDLSFKDLQVLDAKGGFLRINLTSTGIQDPEPVPGDEGIPSAKNFSFSDIKIDDCGTLVEAKGISPLKPLNGLTIENLTGKCRKGMTLVNINSANLRNIKMEGYTGPLLTTANVTGDGLEGAVPYKPTAEPAAKSTAPTNPPPGTTTSP